MRRRVRVLDKIEVGMVIWDRFRWNVSYAALSRKYNVSTGVIKKICEMAKKYLDKGYTLKEAEEFVIKELNPPDKVIR